MFMQLAYVVVLLGPLQSRPPWKLSGIFLRQRKLERSLFLFTSYRIYRIFSKKKKQKKGPGNEFLVVFIF